MDGDISAITVMANIYYDINLARLGVKNEQWAKLVPYLGGGIGVAFLNADVDRIGAASGFDKNDTTFAWQVSGGFVYNFNSRWAGTLNYSYFVAEYPSFDVLDIDYASHNVLAGLRYSFD